MARNGVVRVLGSFVRGMANPVRSTSAANVARPSAAIAYQAAGTGRRGKTWMPTRASIASIVSADLNDLRARSRDAMRNNPHAAEARATLVSNLVGTGIVPRALSDDETRREALRRAWDAWTDEADADGACDYYGLQALAAGEMVEAGEVLIRRRPRRADDGLTVPLQLQIIEPEQLDATYNFDLGQGRVIRNGIQFDAIGRREGYWIWRAHPGDLLGVGVLGGGQRIFVPARDVIHLRHVLRAGMVRGVPWLSNVLTRLYELDQYEDAELVRKKTAALFSAFLEQDPEEGAQTPAEAFGASDSQTDADGDLEVVLEAGTSQVVPKGYKIKFAEPADVGGNFEVWIKHNLRAVAAGIGVTYEQMTGDLSDVNYSSIRAGLLEFRRRVEALQHNLLAFQLNRVVWRWFVEAAVQSGAVPARGFADERADFLRVKWIPQGWSWVDPEKEIKAIVLAIRAGLVSRSDAIAEYGYEAEEIDRELARERQRERDLGLITDTNPAATDQAGKARAPVAPAGSGASAETEAE